MYIGAPINKEKADITVTMAGISLSPNAGRQLGQSFLQAQRAGQFCLGKLNYF
jgi:hypothetical protein